jgi:patatin-related protein
MSSKLEKPDFSHEHRLGLVVYGGVALAIYMNGICQEFYNAVRGRGIYKLIKALTDADIVVDIISGTSAGGINGVLLSYALANSKEQKTNSTQKGKKIRSEIKFEKFASVWKDSGDIQKLLFSKKYDGVEKTSFFDGVGYYKSEIKQALENRFEDLKEAAPEDDWFSEFGELDLFVTGTDTLGRIHQVFDSTGCVIDVKDHQTIFHLKYREYGDNPFKPNDISYEALAKLCQITSCFPVAFPPVTVRLDTQGDADEKLVEWGKLKKNRLLPNQKPEVDKSRSSKKRDEAKKIDDDPGEGYRLHFVDGGVLDNRPFSYTIKEIYHRRAERPVFRKLFYIDPSPDRFHDNPRYKEMLKPDIVQVVLDSLTGMPRYESINNDLELIKEHNEKIRRYKFLLADIEELLDKEVPDIENRDIYDQQRNVYLRTRLISLKDNILPLVFLESDDFLAANNKEKNDNCNKEKEKNYKLDKVAKLLSNPFTDPEKTYERLKLLENLEEEFRYLDIEYALRKYFFISDYVYKLLDREYLCRWLNKKGKKENLDFSAQASVKEEDLDKIIEKLRGIIIKLNSYIKLLEVVKEKLYSFFLCKQIEEYFSNLLDNIDHCSSSEEFATKFYRGMLWLHGRFLDVELQADLSIEKLSNNLQQNSLKILNNLHGDLDELFEKSAKEQISVLNQLSNKSILKKLLEETDKQLDDNPFGDLLKNNLQKYFREFEKFDAFLFPLDYLAGVPEKQEIETYRISPEDAKLGLSNTIEKGKRLAYKLAGDSLNAFGGFFKKSWRANDILWGRLDGLNRLVEALITEDKIRNFLNLWHRESTEHKISEDDYLKYLLDDALFSESLQINENLKKSRKDLEIILNKLKSLNAGNNIEQSSKEDFQKLVSDLVEILVSVGHHVILDQELNGIIQATIEETLFEEQRNQLANNSEALQFNLNEGRFASPVTELAIMQLAQQALGSMPLEEKEKFFRDKYRIGSEGLESIPKSELKKIILRLVRIFQDVLKTWRHRSPFIHTTFWSRLGFKIISYIVIIGLKIFIRRL